MRLRAFDRKDYLMAARMGKEFGRLPHEIMWQTRDIPGVPYESALHIFDIQALGMLDAEIQRQQKR